MTGGDFVFDAERARNALTGGLRVDSRVSWPPLRWDLVIEQHMVRAHNLPHRPQRPRSRAGIELPPYYAAFQVERQLERASALGYLVLPEARARQLRLLAWRNTWWQWCTQERHPFAYVLVGQETPFGRRLVLRWDTDSLIDDDRELKERLRAAWRACDSAWETWWEQLPQAARHAMVRRLWSPVRGLGVAGGMMRGIECAPRPIELVFEALPTGDGLLVIRPSDPVPHQRIAYQVGRLLNRRPATTSICASTPTPAP
jgi:hypothetical protein